MTSPPGDLTSPPGDLGPEGQLSVDQYLDEAGWSSEEWDDDSSNNTNAQDQILHLVTVWPQSFYFILICFSNFRNTNLGPVPLHSPVISKRLRRINSTLKFVGSRVWGIHRPCWLPTDGQQRDSPVRGRHRRTTEGRQWGVVVCAPCRHGRGGVGTCQLSRVHQT